MNVQLPSDNILFSHFLQHVDPTLVGKFKKTKDGKYKTFGGEKVSYLFDMATKMITRVKKTFEFSPDGGYKPTKKVETFSIEEENGKAFYVLKPQV